jgi:hypothetical protein
VWSRELLEFADKVEDRLVYVVEGWSWVQRGDDADMLFGSFECDTHCLLFLVAIPFGRLVEALPFGHLVCDVITKDESV